jgi:hypothetical protein
MCLFAGGMVFLFVLKFGFMLGRKLRLFGFSARFFWMRVWGGRPGRSAGVGGFEGRPVEGCGGGADGEDAGAAVRAGAMGGRFGPVVSSFGPGVLEKLSEFFHGGMGWSGFWGYVVEVRPVFFHCYFPVAQICFWRPVFLDEIFYGRTLVPVCLVGVLHCGAKAFCPV